MSINYTFFGSSRFSVIVLDELSKAGFKPSLIVTTPDKPQGRKLIITPNVVKTWAIDHNIEVLTPEKLDSELISLLKSKSSEVFIVASYGMIIPEEIINIPARKTLNIHPSMLPIYRGASPLQSAILNDTKQTGVSIMRIDKEMDHGPIVAQKEVSVNEWPTYEEFEEQMAREGSKLLLESLDGWLAGEIPEKEQDHSKATYTKKIKKEDAELDLTADPYTNFRKIQAYHEWPQAFFFIEHEGKQLRVKIISAKYLDGQLIIEKVIPEGGKEMTYQDFQSGYRK